MQFYSRLLFCLMSIALLYGGVHGSQRHPAQRSDQPAPRSLTALRRHPGMVKPRDERTAKLVRLDRLMKMENDVMEPKRRRSFPGSNAPLDRLGISAMETKQTANKQSKAGELPRQRFNPPRIDRIGMSSLPNSRG